MNQISHYSSNNQRHVVYPGKCQGIIKWLGKLESKTQKKQVFIWEIGNIKHDLRVDTIFIK